MTPMFTPSRELREYMAYRLDRLARTRPTFRNVDWWDGHTLVVETLPRGKTRRCVRCDELKPLNPGFYSKRTGDGKIRITNTCRSCLTAQRRAYRHANPEQERAAAARRYQRIKADPVRLAKHRATSHASKARKRRR